MRDRIQVDFDIPSIQLDVMTTKGAQTPTESEGKSLGTLLVKDIHTGVKMLTDDSMEVQVDIKSYGINDVRPGDERPYSQVLPQANENEQRSISVNYKKTDQGSRIVKISLCNPVIILILDFLFALMEFLSRGLIYFNAGEILSDKQEKSKGKEENSLAKKVPSDVFFIVLNISNAEAMVVENPKAKNSEAIVMTLKSLTFSHQDNTWLSVDEVGMYLCNLDSRESTTLRIADDFDLSMTAEEIPPQSSSQKSLATFVPGELHVNLRISRPVIFRISYQDALLVLAILNTTNELSQEFMAEEDTITAISETEFESMRDRNLSNVSLPISETEIVERSEKVKCVAAIWQN